VTPIEKALIAAAIAESFAERVLSEALPGAEMVQASHALKVARANRRDAAHRWALEVGL